jgi:uncharacterized protein
MTVDWRDAVQRSDIEALDRQLAAGADINALDEHGQTALMNAARDGQAGVVSFLCERGANPDHHAKYGLTAVMLAVIRGHAAIVRILVTAGADLTCRGTGAPGFHQKTAADIARERGDEVSLRYLDEAAGPA